MWDVNVDLSDHDIIALYHAHGESEQFHSEVKTDMDLERFPSGKFEFFSELQADAERYRQEYEAEMREKGL